jgi:hypothetical protein
MKFFHPIFGTGEKTGERITESGQTVFEIRFADCTRTILSNCLLSVADDRQVSVKRAGVANPRIRATVGVERQRPRKTFESA